MSTDEDRQIGNDIEAFRRATQRRLPTWDETAQATHTRLVRRTREKPMTKLVRSFRHRPVLATAFGVAAVAVILLAVPVSYERTIGYELKVELPAVDAARAGQVALGLAGVLQTKDYSWNTDAGKAAVLFRLPLGSRSMIEGLARGYLAKASLEGTARVLPVLQKVTGNVYAAAAAELIEIRVNREGKSDAEVAAEIQGRLAEAGMPGSSIVVTTEGGQTHLEMHWQAAPGDSVSGEKQVTIGLEGEGRR